MKKKTEITKDILISDLIEQNPKLIQILTEKYGLHCIGCMAASMETLEQGALVHGMSKKQIDKMVEKLNQEVSGV
jgi:hybrid cluster-associated redox disulfide protein